MAKGPPYPTEAPSLPDIPTTLIDQANELFIRLNSSYFSQFEKLERVFKYFESFSSYTDGFTSCRKGCAYCCKVDVQITSFEAKYIAKKKKMKMNEFMSISTGNKAPCPFLSPDNSCGIYEIRPLICRTLQAVGDPDHCRTGAPQLYYGSPPQFGNVILRDLMAWAHRMNQEKGGSLGDIRDFFPMESRLKASMPADDTVAKM